MRIRRRWRIATTTFVLTFLLVLTVGHLGGQQGIAGQSFIVKPSVSLQYPQGNPDASNKLALIYANAISQLDPSQLLSEKHVSLGSTQIGGSAVFTIAVTADSQADALRALNALKERLLSASPPTGIIPGSVSTIGSETSSVEGYAATSPKFMLAAAALSLFVALAVSALRQMQDSRLFTIEQAQRAGLAAPVVLPNDLGLELLHWTWFDTVPSRDADRDKRIRSEMKSQLPQSSVENDGAGSGGPTVALLGIAAGTPVRLVDQAIGSSVGERVVAVFFKSVEW